MITSINSSFFSPFFSAKSRCYRNCSGRCKATSAATVARLRSRLESSGRSQTSPKRTWSVKSASLGAKSPIAFWDAAGSLLMLVPSRARPRRGLSCSAVDHLLEMFGVAGSLYFDVCGGAIDFAEIIVREVDRKCSDVFVEARELRGTGDRNHPRLLRKKPCEGDLSGCRLLALCDPADQINDRLIRFSVFRLKARNGIAEIGAIEGRGFVNLACQETLAQRAEGNEAD